MNLPPRDFQALRERILARRSSLSPRLQQIARFALEHPNEIAVQTIAMIAGRISVPPSAMIRFAKALGYRGFSDMQAVFRLPLDGDMTGGHAAQLWSSAAAPITAPHAATGGVLETVSICGDESLRCLMRDVSPARLDQAAALLMAKRAVYVVGQRYSFPVAAYLAHALTHLQRHVHLLDGVGGMLRGQGGAFCGDDLLVAVSLPPYALETTELVSDAAARGAAIIAITSGPASPIACAATLCLDAHAPEIHGFPTLTATLCLVQALAVRTRLSVEAPVPTRKATCDLKLRASKAT